MICHHNNGSPVRIINVHMVADCLIRPASGCGFVPAVHLERRDLVSLRLAVYLHRELDLYSRAGIWHIACAVQHGLPFMGHHCQAAPAKCRGIAHSYAKAHS